jgi:hypothetical protein
MTNPVTKTKNFGNAWRILRVIAGLSLVYYTWMMLDLITHPFNAGSNAGSIPYLFRWLSAACGTYTVVVAVFILRRIQGNSIGFLLLLFGVGAAGWSQRIDFGTPQANRLLLILFTFYFFALSFPALTALLFHFPTGQIYPAQLTGWAWGLVISQGLAGILSNMGVPSFQNGLIPNVAYIPALLPYAGPLNWFAVLIPPLAGVVSLALRYRAGAHRVRMQIKWLVWLAAIALTLSALGAILFPDSSPGQTSTSLSQLAKIILFLYWQLFPAAAIGIALLRYRLWDIDLIIRRTLVYSVLTALLALIYLGGVTLLQQILTVLTGQQSPAAVVLSTLLIAALFTPLRRRVQDFIDRRFYRRKYDVEQTLNAFNESIRSEVNFDQLSAELVNVVQESMQPDQMSLWLSNSIQVQSTLPEMQKNK